MAQTRETKLEQLIDAAHRLAHGYLSATVNSPEKHPCGSCKEHAEKVVELLGYFMIIKARAESREL